MDSLAKIIVSYVKELIKLMRKLNNSDKIAKEMLLIYYLQ